jgi:hypothetical protein
MAARYRSSSKSGSGRPKLYGEAEYVYQWTWACCNCSSSAGMTTVIDHCPDCQHLRCDNCPAESNKIRASRSMVARDRFPLAKPASTSTHTDSTTRGNSPKSIPTSNDSHWSERSSLARSSDNLFSSSYSQSSLPSSAYVNYLSRSFRT